MADKTGADLKAGLLGDAATLEDATKYTMELAGSVRVPVRFSYTIPDPVAPDDGSRQITRVVELSAAEFAAGLSADNQKALLDLVASKL